MYVELLAHLEQARAALGSVSPQFSYFQRLVNAAHADDQLLFDLHRRVVRDGCFQ
jgi:hypothetical protein